MLPLNSYIYNNIIWKKIYYLYCSTLRKPQQRDKQSNIQVPSTLIRHENRAFQKRSSNWRNVWKRRLFVSLWRESSFENGVFWKRRPNDNKAISLTEFSSSRDRCCGVKFLRLRVDGKHLIRFQSKTSVFKFPRCSVDGKHLMRF